MKRILEFILVMAMLIWFGDIKHFGDGDICFVLVMHPKKGLGHNKNMKSSGPQKK